MGPATLSLRVGTIAPNGGRELRPSAGERRDFGVAPGNGVPLWLQSCSYVTLLLFRDAFLRTIPK